MAADAPRLHVEVAYARPDQQVVLAVELEAGATARQAVERSGLLDDFPEIELGTRNKLGVFGKLVKPEAALREGDRVEVYRPLIADPKEVRRRRAAEGKKTGKGGGRAEGE